MVIVRAFLGNYAPNMSHTPNHAYERWKCMGTIAGCHCALGTIKIIHDTTNAPIVYAYDSMRPYLEQYSNDANAHKLTALGIRNVRDVDHMCETEAKYIFKDQQIPTWLLPHAEFINELTMNERGFNNSKYVFWMNSGIFYFEGYKYGAICAKLAQVHAEMLACVCRPCD